MLAPALAGLLLVSCQREPVARVVSAEFLDETPDETLRPGETIRLRLDRPLPDSWPAAAIRVVSDPPADWSAKVRPGRHPLVLDVTVVSGRPNLRTEGVHGEDDGATGLVIDLGDEVLQTVDLQPRRPVPLLEAAVWEDASPPGGNGVVDEGDRLRLVFDQPVEIAPEARGRPVDVPTDVLLSRDSLDRLDDGSDSQRRATWDDGSNSREVDIVLGSRPILKVEGSLPGDPARIDRFGTDAPSGIALAGTDIRPLPWIVSPRGGDGAASRLEVDIEFADDDLQVVPRPEDTLPPPGNRWGHTVTPLLSTYAVIVGGRDSEKGQALDDVLLYHARHAVFDAAPFVRARLPRPVYDHTATLLGGATPAVGDFERYVVVAGGTDGRRPGAELTVIRITSSGGKMVAQPLPSTLHVPRYRHRAVAVGPDTLLIDGGRTHDADGRPVLTGCAELLTFELVDGAAGREPRVARHVLLRSLAREAHSLTLLAGRSENAPWVLSYGGFGRNLHRDPLAPGRSIGDVLTNEGEEDERLEYSLSRSSVLVSPILINLNQPEASLRLPTPSDVLPYLRRLHVGVGLAADGDLPGRASAEALIVGGTLAHPVRGYEGNLHELWEIPTRSLPVLRRRPESQDAAGAVRIQFDAEFPRDTRLEVILHHAPDPGRAPLRIHASATQVPGLGWLIVGGEIPSTPDDALEDSECLSTVDLYLPDEARLVPWARELSVPRARHRAWLSDGGDRRSLLLIGGRTTPQAVEEFTDIEEMPLPDRTH